ncbi:MAG TPA: MATE family efflux transporter [Clostridiaceae bacterium]|nr:MATE family efflux transporter [Clostridiaceae bacterium]
MAVNEPIPIVKNKSKTEMILKGPMYKVILAISLPLIINNLIMTLYNMADAFFVGQLGTTEFAAVSFVNPVMFLFQSIGMGIQIAGTSILAQLIGKNKIHEAKEYAWHVMLFTVAAGLVLGFSGYYTSPYIIRFMGGTGRFGDLSLEYLRFIFLGVPPQIVFMGFVAIMNAQGNTKSSTLVNSFSAIINIILDPFFIFDRIPVIGLKGLGLGVGGAAIATSLAHFILMILGYYVMRKTSRTLPVKFRNIPFDKNKLTKIIRVGLPSSAGHSGAAFGFILLNTFIAGYGTSLLAAFSLINRINNMIMMPAMGIGSGLTSIVGQNMGANEPSRVRDGFWKAVKLSTLISVLGAALIYLFRYQLIYFFTPTADDLMVSQSLEYLTYILPTIPLMGLFSIFQGLFQGSGHTRFSMFMAIGRLWLIRIPLILIFSNFTGLGQRGIWIAMNVSNILVVIYGFYIYRSNMWAEEVI